MWYPPIDPHQCGLLDVGGGHRLYWETCGNPRGLPVLFLHGGPGGSCTPNSRRWFDPRRYRIIAFDQRGCGRSLPHGHIDNNTTAHLLGDIESVRLALGVERWMIMGRSWGSALAVAYAEQHPDRAIAMVLSGVFTARHSELNWLYGGGAAQWCPDAWSRFIAPLGSDYQHNLVAAYHARLTTGDSALQIQAARAWCEWEHALTTRRPIPLPDNEAAIVRRARLQAHFFLHRAFLAEGRLLADAHRLRGVEGVIVQGAEDRVTPPITALELHRAWPGSELRVIPGAGHSSTEPDVMRALIDATDALACRFPAPLAAI